MSSNERLAEKIVEREIFGSGGGSLNTNCFFSSSILFYKFDQIIAKP
jgi:hypothetical protein